MEPTRTEFLFMPGPLPKLLFYTLTFASLGWMVWQFVAMARTWRRGKPDEPKRPWWPEVASLILGQRKVQGSRPKGGGPMHLLIFYGFMALLMATTLLALATYAPMVGLPNWHKGAYYLAFEATFDVLGACFVAGCAWALFRRLGVGRPATLQGDRTDVAALVILFTCGLTGYLLEAARIAADPHPWDVWSPVGYGLSPILGQLAPSAYVGLWWFHMAWVWAFFVMLPRMRLRHLVVATVTAANRPARAMGALAKVSMEQVEATGKVGAVETGDLTRWHLTSLDACMECGRCTEVCPANGVGKTLDPRGIVQGIRAAEGNPLLEKLTEDDLWACTTCHACVEACPVSIRHVDLIVDVRRNLVAEGKLAGPQAVMLRQVGSTGHAWGQPVSEREQWMKGLNVPLCREGQPFDFLLWVGCAGATDPGAVKTTKAVATLLQWAGVSFACLGQEEACTGDPARRTGDEFTFQELAGQNANVFAKYGVTKVVTACPHCFNSLKNEYGDFGSQMEVLHHSQLLARLVREGRLAPADVPGGVTLHDPCYLARVNDEADAPRALLGAETDFNRDVSLFVRENLHPLPVASQLVEPAHHAQRTLCCGAGGGRMWADDAPGQRPADRRAEELLATGAETVAVACPFCRIMLDPALTGKTRVADVAELLLEANRQP
ncbi:MAG: (Fe-S)-binding protein [Armatimonadetes bacterium]|nr:(Fe-S)-binding protein [Armatimonadota bacterium]